MKILTLHCDYIKFKPLKKAIKSPEELKEKGEINVKEPLVVLTAVEKGDNDKTVAQLVDAVKKTAGEVKAKNIVLYPYAHLSSNLADPETALEYLVEAEQVLKKESYNVTRAPFGYYKEFELKVKGHPLSELSKEFHPESLALTPKDVVKICKEKEENIEQILNKLSKTKMSSEKAPNGLKSNVEIGKELDLYLINEVVGPGLPLLTPKGATIRREIERFIVDEELKRGYEFTNTPIMAKSDLFKISGHWQHYKEFMFTMDVHGETFALRPMTCPFHFVIYKSKTRSYKELPIKYAEISPLFRNEKSGELMGLTRLRQFTLADAHIICLPEQMENEFSKVLELINYIVKTLGIKDTWFRFSKWDPKNKEKYVDNPKAWEKTQKTMKKILDKLKVKYVEAENEAAFYGPKFDMQYKNIFGKEDTLITVQIDFAMPEKFDLSYIDRDNKTARPIVIHRSSVGCLERTMAYILEKTQGSLPLWLSPVQVRVINLTDRNAKSCEKILKEIKEEILNLRIDSDFRSTTVSDKVRDAEMQKIPYVVVIGDKEEESKTIAVRERGNAKPKFKVKLKSFVEEIRHKILRRE
ncbi:threonine--tRNA ligase [Candidatus Pacearchaeota archaeon]|nr:threonine--tRNA ligase [Candidatus Pacearchaeota archaeon]